MLVAMGNEGMCFGCDYPSDVLAHYTHDATGDSIWLCWDCHPEIRTLFLSGVKSRYDWDICEKQVDDSYVYRTVSFDEASELLKGASYD